MANSLFSKDRLMEYGALGVGAATASIVKDKLVPMLPAAVASKPIVGQLTPVAVGILLPTLIKGTAVRNISDGMIAVGIGSIVSGLLKSAGIGEVLMGDVLMGETSYAEPVMMGASEDSFGFNQFSSTSGDSTPSFAGEMDF